jgi:hypothetical protein
MRHPKAGEIARFGAGALVQRQAAKVGTHVDGCPRCRKARDRIAAVRQVLAAANYPPVPDLVASEIGLALAIETAQRNIPDAASWHPGFRRERSHGIARSAAGLIQFAHLAWAYHDKEELAARAAEYAEDGIAAGQYVELVGLGSPEGLHGPFRRLTSSSTVHQALESGRAGMRGIADYYQLAGEVVDAEASVARRVAASPSARAAGLNGTRIIVDCTATARTLSSATHLPATSTCSTSRSSSSRWPLCVPTTRGLLASVQLPSSRASIPTPVLAPRHSSYTPSAMQRSVWQARLATARSPCS